MPLPGRKIQLLKWIHGTRCVLRLHVEGVIPDADPSEPVLEPKTIRLLDELQALADRGDVLTILTRAPAAELFVPIPAQHRETA
jgi:hypothetical protein